MFSSLRRLRSAPPAMSASTAPTWSFISGHFVTYFREDCALIPSPPSPPPPSPPPPPPSPPGCYLQRSLVQYEGATIWTERYVAILRASRRKTLAVSGNGRMAASKAAFVKQHSSQ